MTRGKHDEKSAARIAKAKPGSREAHAAAKAAERNRANAGTSGQNGSNSRDTYNQGAGGWTCQLANRSGGRCSVKEPCDSHSGSWRRAA